MLLLSPLSSGCSESPCQSLSSHCTPEPCWVRKSTTLCSHDKRGKDDEGLSCKMLVCLPQPCNTCCNFEDAFSFPIKLGNARSHEAFLFFCLSIPQKSHHLQSICSVCCGWTWTRFFFFFSGGMTQDVPVSSPYFFQTHIFMSCFVSVFLCGRLSRAGIPDCRDAEWVWSELRGPAAQLSSPQARWTLRAVWIPPAGCSSHCVIGRIMFRDSLSFAPPYVLLEQLGAF